MSDLAPIPSANLLMHFERAKRALADAVSLQYTRDFYSAAVAFEAFAREANDASLIADAIELRQRAARRCGQMLRDMARRGERARRGGDRRSKSVAATLKLADLNITKQRASDWQSLAALPEPDFEARLAAARREAVQSGDMPRAAKQAAKRAKRAAREEALGAKISALPDRRYGVIYADPEWKFASYSLETGMDRAPDNHYPCSDTDAICARDVASIAADDCVLFLWATAPMLPDALRVMAAWGFDYKSHIVWIKDRAGTGYWARNRHELLLIGVRGNIPAPAMGEQPPSAIEAPVAAHSAKPDVFAEMIETMFPSLRKMELNRRGPARPGWDAWGNEADE